MFCAREDTIRDPVHLIVLQVDRVNIGELRWTTNWVRVKGISGQCEGREIRQRAEEAIGELGYLVALHIKLIKINASAERAWD